MVGIIQALDYNYPGFEFELYSLLSDNLGQVTSLLGVLVFPLLSRANNTYCIIARLNKAKYLKHLSRQLAHDRCSIYNS